MDEEIIDDLLDGVEVVGADPSMDKATLYAFCVEPRSEFTNTMTLPSVMASAARRG